MAIYLLYDKISNIFESLLNSKGPDRAPGGYLIIYGSTILYGMQRHSGVKSFQPGPINSREGFGSFFLFRGRMFSFNTGKVNKGSGGLLG